MRMKQRYRIIPLILLILWGCRYYYVNNGHLSAHLEQTVQNYQMGDTFEFGDNESYYQYKQNGCVMLVQSAKKYTLDEFCKTYQINKDDFFYTCDEYIELSVALENRGNSETNLELLGLALRGSDWYSFYDDMATTFANCADTTMGSVSSLQLPLNSPCSIKIVYGLQKGNFPLSRWNNFKDEDMWLIATIKPIEKRIKISL